MLRPLAFVVSLFMLSSCATVFAKHTRSILVTSNPPGAEIIVKGKSWGVTPVRLKVDNHKDLALTIRKEGFHGAGCIVNTKIRALWVIADVALIYLLVPLVVDLVTNNWAQLESEFCTVNLLPRNSPDA